MALQFIYGNSGSGKSEYIYTKAAEMASESPYQRIYVVVPEQATLQAQKSLVEHSGNGVIMNIDVVSFERLAYRVFDELGIQTSIMEETGKCLVLRRIAEEKWQDMTVLRGNVRRMGYINELKSMISEFLQYGIDPNGLDDIISKLSRTTNLHGKLHDISVMYHAFEEFLSDHYITAEKVLEVLWEHVEDSELLQGAVFIFDGFTGFTPVQTKLLHRLLRVSRDIYVTVTMEAGADFYRAAQLQDLFYMSRKMIHSLISVARMEQVEISEPVLIAPSGKSRLAGNPVLTHLEQNMFRKGEHPYPDSCGDMISVTSLASPKDELQFAASTICRLMREKNYRYGDFAIVSGDVEGYAKYAESVFHMYEIPFFTDQKTTVLYHPLTELIRAILEIVESDYSIESVFRYLRTGLTDFAEADIDLLENYIQEKGIHGASGWREKFHLVSRQNGRLRQSEEALQRHLFRLNELRELFWKETQCVYECFRDKSSNVRVQTECLYNFLAALHMEERLDKSREQFEESGDLLLASQYRQIYRIIIDLFDKMVDLLGEEHLDAADYMDILEAGFSAAKVGSIPPGTDCVILGDIERTRLDDTKVLFFLGINDGVIPKSASRGSILSQYDRELLCQQDVELSPTAKEQSFIQRFYLYLNMTKPSDALYLTYARMSADGKSVRTSYLIGVIEKLFPKIQRIELDAEQPFYSVNPESSTESYLKGLNLSKKGIVIDDWKALHRWFMNREEDASTIQNLFDAAFRCFEGEHLEADVAKVLYGTVLTNSVSRLERYATCAFAHFLEYGLKLAPRAEYSFADLDMGSMFHAILQNYCSRLEASNDWDTISDEEQDKLIGEAIQDAILAMPNHYLLESERNRYVLERIRRIVKRSVWALTEQIRRGVFLPYGYEVEFSRVTELSELTEGKMRLVGKVDRMDVYEDEDKVYVKVIDYKSSGTKFQLLNLYYGRQLQLVVYLNAAMEKMKEEYPDREIVPAAIFYYHLDDPMLKEDDIKGDFYHAMLKTMKPDGLINLDPDVCRKMDPIQSGYSEVIPLYVSSKDGMPSIAKSSGAMESDFHAMQSFVNEKIRQAAAKIMEGDINVLPYERKDRNGCEYCDYNSICGFDRKISGYRYHREESLTADAIWEAIRKGGESQDE